MENQTGSKLGKKYVKAVLLSLYLFILYTKYIMWNARLDEAQTGIKIAGRNINNLRYADDTTLMVESEGGLKEPLDESQWKSWFKTPHSENKDPGIQFYQLMANRRGNNGNRDRISFLGLKNHYRWWLQPFLAPWKKSMTNLAY